MAFNFLRTKKKAQAEQPTALATSLPTTDVFGLFTLIEPDATPLLNIVFVHGLGGSAHNTWTDDQTKAFWPPWLAKVTGLENARIMTFGYDSNWKKIWKPNNVLDVPDFARQLVNELWLHYADHGDTETLFMAHSMGGLVVKQALIIAHNNATRYHQITKNTIGIAFLGTPHRGADLAKMLKRLLDASFSESRFVKDLLPNSQIIKEINDAFPERAQTLQLASFSESTAMTLLGIVVPEFSATLGLPGEIRVALDGDHLAIVKYSSEEDNNFRRVSRNIAGLVRAARIKQDSTTETKTHIFHVRYDRNPFFTGRKELFEEIRRKLHDDQQGYKHKIALYGLGGIGKTQISLEYCYRYQRDYDYIFWLSADNRTRLLSSFRKVANLFTEHGEKVSDGTADDIANAVLRKLERKKKWLLVYDNLDDIRVADGYLPRTQMSGGHVLITTRNKNCDGIPAEGVEINLFNAEDSISMLLQRAGLANDEREQVKVEARKIVEVLGYLPLAIEQAASYIKRTHNIFEYLETYHQNQKEMLLTKPIGNHPYGESVFTTWKISFRQLEQTSPDSIPLSQILAFMNPDETLVEFLQHGKAGLQPGLHRIFQNNFVFRQSLCALEEYSLIRIWDAGRKITIHRLVQDVIRNDLDVSSQTSISAQVVKLALATLRLSMQEWNHEKRRTFYPQITAILTNVKKHPATDTTIRDIEHSYLYARLAFYLNYDGFYSDAAKYYEIYFEISKRLLGQEHPETLRSMDSVAAAYFKLGRNREAAKVGEACLTIRKRVFGEEHPETLSSMHGLAAIYYHLGQADRAVSIQKTCLEIRKRVLGEEHAETLLSMSSLAAIYSGLGRFNEAVIVAEACLEIQRRVLGDEHPDTLWSMNGVVADYCNQRRWNEAVELCETCLEIRKKVLGEEHPDTLVSMQNLTVTYHGLGRLNEAASLAEACLEGQKKVLGDEHPHTVNAMTNVAIHYKTLGRFNEAINLGEACVEINTRKLGEEHPNTQRTMHILAELRQLKKASDPM